MFVVFKEDVRSIVHIGDGQLLNRQRVVRGGVKGEEFILWFSVEPRFETAV